MKNALFTLLFATAFSLIQAADEGAKLSERISAILSEAGSKRLEGHEKVEREFRTAVAATFQFADRIEIYLLDHTIGEDAAQKPKDGDKTFPIRPYDQETKILKTRKVPAKDIQKWCAAVTKTITSDRPPTGFKLCHFPIHGLRIYARDNLLFETSICWNCLNYYFETRWQALTSDAEELQKLLDDFMPIPKKEKASSPSNQPKGK